MFKCPPDTLIVFAQVLNEYDFGSLPDLKAPVVLDIGANVGAFAWAVTQRRYKDARVICYEPHPNTYDLLQDNARNLLAAGAVSIETHGAAVVHPRKSETVRLYEGKNASTEASIRDDVRWPHVSQDLERWHDVPCIDADALPPCDLMKVDTEGSEVEILTGYKHLAEVKVLLVECHAVGGDLKGQMQKVAELAMGAGLSLVDVRGTTMRFVHSSASKMAIPEGQWWDVHAIGGERWIGICAAVGEGATMKLSHAVRVGPDRLTVPVPVPGGSIARAHLDCTEPSVWIPLFLDAPRDIEVCWSSRMPLSFEEASKALAGLRSS